MYDINRWISVIQYIISGWFSIHQLNREKDTCFTEKTESLKLWAVNVLFVITEQRGVLMGFFVAVILIIFLFDFTKLRKQNQTMIEQNEKIISLLEEIKDKK